MTKDDYAFPECKRGEHSTQRMTMHFLSRLNPAFDQRRRVFLAQKKIPPLEEAIMIMIQEESRKRLHSEASGLQGMRSALAASNSCITWVQVETRKCYNCDEMGHLSKIFPRPPKE